MPRMLSTLLALSLLLSCARAGGPDTDRIRAVEEGLLPPVLIKGVKPWTLAERMRHYKAPGVSIAVIKDFSVEWARGYGTKEAGSSDPVDEQTLFLAGSVSKPVAAALALTMVEEGKLLLDQDINAFLRSWKIPENEHTKRAKVTLERILSHTAGLTVQGFPGYEVGTDIPTLVQVLDGVPPANTAPVRVDTEPGTRHRYSGGGTTVAQLAMMDIERRPFPEIARARVFDVIGMRSSTYEQPLPSDKQVRAASGHRADGAIVPGKWHVYPEMAAAGLWTTPGDLAVFAIEIQRAYRGDAGRILMQETVRRMLTPVKENAGLGFFLDTEAKGRYFQHGGADEGFRTALVAHVDSGYGAIVMVNSDNGGIMSEILRAVASVYNWEGYLPPALEPVVLAPEALGTFKGTYMLHADDAIRVEPGEGRLVAWRVGGEGFDLYPLSSTEFARAESPVRYRFAGTGSAGFDTLLILGRSTTVGVRKEGKVTLPRSMLEAGETDRALAAYRQIRSRNPESAAVEEVRLNQLGYEYLARRRFAEAIAVFKLNVEFYPDSWNVYDSLGEAYMESGNRELAIQFYERSIDLNPKNANGAAVLKKLKSE